MLCYAPPSTLSRENVLDDEWPGAAGRYLHELSLVREDGVERAVVAAEAAPPEIGVSDPSPRVGAQVTSHTLLCVPNSIQIRRIMAKESRLVREHAGRVAHLAERVSRELAHHEVNTTVTDRTSLVVTLGVLSDGLRRAEVIAHSADAYVQHRMGAAVLEQRLEWQPAPVRQHTIPRHASDHQRLGVLSRVQGPLFFAPCQTLLVLRFSSVSPPRAVPFVGRSRTRSRFSSCC
jgi:hypothetical protein